MALLTNHQEVIENISNYVLWLVPVLAFGSVAYMLDGYFLGLTRGALLRNSSLIATLAGFAPMATVAWLIRSSHLLWLALAMFMAARAITLAREIPQHNQL